MEKNRCEPQKFFLLLLLCSSLSLSSKKNKTMNRVAAPVRARVVASRTGVVAAAVPRNGTW